MCKAKKYTFLKNARSKSDVAKAFGRLLPGLMLLFMIGSGCNKQDLPENPFQNYTPNQDTVRFIYQDPDSFSIAGIFSYILKPTCSNVGCHDGTFEPDFRTLESAYNTLVYRSSIKDDGRFPQRVQPGDANRSGLMARLRGQLLPYMPIQLEPDSDWELNKDHYIHMIKTWIERGAPAIDGTLPGNHFPQIRLEGAIAWSSDSARVMRAPLAGPLLIDTLMDSINLFFAFSHDQDNPLHFTVNTIDFSSDPHDFSTEIRSLPLSKLSLPVPDRGIYGQWANYTHQVRISVKELFPDAPEVFFRVNVKDSRNPAAQLPGQHALFNLKRYMSFERVN